MSVDVMLGVCFLRRRPIGVLPVLLGGAGAAVWRRPAVTPAVGLAQRQVSAVPLTVALQQSRNRFGGKESAQRKKEEQTRAAGQNKHTQTNSRAHESTGPLEAKA